jgi:hypothetical protein
MGPNDLLEAVVSQIAFDGGGVSLTKCFSELASSGVVLDAHERRWIVRELLSVPGLSFVIGNDGIPSRARASVELQERALGVNCGLQTLNDTLTTVLRAIAKRSEKEW